MGHTLLLDDVRLPGEDDHVQVAVRDGTIVALGPALDVDADERIALGGRTALPGLWDHHVHATQWASARTRVDVADAGSAREAAEAVRRFVAAGGGRGEVLLGHGMHHLSWPDMPSRQLLDDAAPGLAVVLAGADLHTAWVSTTSLDRLGLPVTDTGLLHEADCFRALAELGDTSPDEQDAWVADATRAAATRGVTGIRDFEFGDPLVDWQRRLAAHQIDVRVVANVYPEALDAALARGWATGRPVDGTDGQLEVGHLKLFVDGALNSRTAWCDDPYPGGDPDDRGSLAASPDELLALVRRAATVGIQPAIHAIGDRAVGVALDVLEAANTPGRIEHAQLVRDADLDRLARDGVVVGVQPAHLLDDREVAERLWAGRTGRAFRYAALARAGARLELGSDAPVSPLDPWRGIAAAVTRTGDERPPWHPEQALDVRTALTTACGGRLHLAPGDVADLVVLDDDPLRARPAALADPSIWGTMLGGRWTYRA